MQPRYGDTFGYRVVLTIRVAAWLFFAVVCGLFMSMSLTGRINGGAGINAVVTVVVLTWFAGVTAWALVATWKWRKVSDPRLLTWLVHRSRPSDPALADVWRWERIGLWCLVAFAGELAILFALYRVGVLR